MVIESGILLGVGVIVMYLKSPLALRHWMAQHQFLSDVFVGYALWYIHDGGVTGTLSAAIGTMVVSLFVSFYSILNGWR